MLIRESLPSLAKIMSYKTVKEPLHFQAECLMCGESLLARTSTLAELVAIVQVHFKLHKNNLSAKEVLESEKLKWTVTGATPFTKIIDHYNQVLKDPIRVENVTFSETTILLHGTS